MKQVVLMRIVSGCLTLKQCYFITVTYRLAGQETRRDAASVQKDWTELLRTLKYRLSNRNIAWLKIVEATKKGQPHLHLIVGGIGNRVACCESDRLACYHGWNQKRMVADCERDCIEHEWAKAWFDITGDSYIVNSKPILGAYGAGAYLSKYLVKGMAHRRVLQELGFARRWSKSRNWPAKDVLQLEGTLAQAWVHTRFGYKGWPWNADLAASAESREFNVLNKRIGTEMAAGLAARAYRHRSTGFIRKVFDASNRTETESAHNQYGHGRSDSGIPTPDGRGPQQHAPGGALHRPRGRISD